MKRLTFLITMLLTLILGSCSNSDASTKTEILVAAASSMTPALTDIAAKFEETNKDIKVTFTFGSSGKLAQQIKGGAPVDVYISANSTDMDILEKADKIEPNTRATITKNTLVVIQQKGGVHSLLNAENPLMTEETHFAIGNPDTVPAGIYAKEALVEMGEWEGLEPTFVFGKDVRQVLTFVETGNAERGIVFTSDAKSSDRVEVILEINPELHSSADYPGAIVASTEQPEAAHAFLDYMKTQKVQEVLTDYGFTN